MTAPSESISAFRVLATGPTPGTVNLLLAVLAGVLAAIGAAGWWVSGHPEEIRGFFHDLRHDPRLLRFRDRHRGALEFLLRRLRPEGAAGVFLSAGLVALAASAVAFGGVLQDVVAHDELAVFDSPILTFIASHRAGWLTTAMRSISLLGRGPVLALVVVVAGLAFRRLRHRWEPLVILAVASAGAKLLSLGVKVVVARPRPPAVLMAAAAHGYGFPSGHATQSALYGALAFLVGEMLPQWQAKVRVWVGAVMVAFLLGASRVYLGVHWPTDVLGGWALAAGWLAIVITTTTGIRRLRSPEQTAEAAAPPSQAPVEVASVILPPARPPTDPGGLSEAQVRERIERGETNQTVDRSSRTVGEILRANILTRFNALLGSLAVVIALTGSLKDALFALVLVANTAIGIIQELRAKATAGGAGCPHRPGGAGRGGQAAPGRKHRPRRRARAVRRGSGPRRWCGPRKRRPGGGRVAFDRRSRTRPQGCRRTRSCRGASSWPEAPVSRPTGSGKPPMLACSPLRVAASHLPAPSLGKASIVSLPISPGPSCPPR